MATGPRRVHCAGEVKTRFADVIAHLEPSLIVSGGAQGVDTLWAETGVALGIPLCILLPNRYYRQIYPRSIPEKLLRAASEVSYAVERPEDANWRIRWSAERWWLDNFTRNEVMVKNSDETVCVSALEPRSLMLLGRTGGGTGACLREVRKARQPPEVIWVPDAMQGNWRRVSLCAPSLFDR